MRAPQDGGHLGHRRVKRDRCRPGVGGAVVRCRQGEASARPMPGVLWGWGAPGLSRAGAPRWCPHFSGELGLRPQILGRSPRASWSPLTWLCHVASLGKEASLSYLLAVYWIGALFSGQCFWSGGERAYVSSVFLGSGLGLLLRLGPPFDSPPAPFQTPFLC